MLREVQIVGYSFSFIIEQNVTRSRISRKFGESLTFYCTFDFPIEKARGFREAINSRVFIGHCVSLAAILPRYYYAI